MSRVGHLPWYDRSFVDMRRSFSPIIPNLILLLGSVHFRTPRFEGLDHGTGNLLKKDRGQMPIKWILESKIDLKQDPTRIRRGPWRELPHVGQVIEKLTVKDCTGDLPARFERHP